jgi:hypothetical protein
MFRIGTPESLQIQNGLAYEYSRLVDKLTELRWNVG